MPQQHRDTIHLKKKVHICEYNKNAHVTIYISQQSGWSECTPTIVPTLQEPHSKLQQNAN